MDFYLDEPVVPTMQKQIMDKLSKLILKSKRESIVLFVRGLFIEILIFSKQIALQIAGWLS